MGYVFISYSTKNQTSANKLKEILHEKGIAAWMAPEDIPAGSVYAKVINQAIKGCSCCVLLLTEDAQKSNWVSREIERAVHYEKQIFPVQLGEVILNDEFQLYIGICQITVLRDMEAASREMRKLCESIHKCLEQYEKAETVRRSEMRDVTGAESRMSASEEAWKMFDDMLFMIGEIIEEQERKTAVLNPNRLKQMQRAYAAIKGLTSNTDATVTYHLHEPYKSMGSIVVEGENLEFANSELFVRAAEFASNTEVYPLVNGKVRLTLTFHGLVRICE